MNISGSLGLSGRKLQENFLLAHSKQVGSKKIYVRSVRKSGTHLLMKIIELLGLQLINDHKLHFFRLGNSLSSRIKSLSTNKKYCCIYRDPRDAMIALILRKTKLQAAVNLSMSKIHNEIDLYLEKIKKTSFTPPKRQVLDYKSVLYLKKHPQKNCLLLRFEDLVPEFAGGPADEVRFKELKKICTFVKKDVSDEKILEVMRSCWGGTGTFRVNQTKKVGQWVEYMSPTQIIKFRDYFNPFLIGLGYEADPNWHIKYLQAGQNYK